VLNASGAELSAGHTGFFVDPVRPTTTTTNVVHYNPSTHELTYNNGSVLNANAPLVDEAGTISINFTAVKAEIPAGTGVAKVGALIPPPAYDGYVLRADAGEATGLTWSAVTDTLSASSPLLVGESNPGDPYISIAFTAVKGEIPAGTGATSEGDLVPAPTHDGQVLTSDLSQDTGLAWKEIPSGIKQQGVITFIAGQTATVPCATITTTDVVLLNVRTITARTNPDVGLNNQFTVVVTAATGFTVVGLDTSYAGTVAYCVFVNNSSAVNVTSHA
jgi:hypothetical protein